MSENAAKIIPTDDDKLVDEQFVAEYYGVSTRTVKTWRYRGSGPRYIRVAPQKVKYRWGDIRAYNAEESFSSTTEETEKRRERERSAA